MTQAQALEILKTGANVFLTGEPGAGKSHTVNEYVAYLRSHGIEPAITASTGIAATHIGGMTIHSWSGIGIKDKLSPYELDALASSEYIAKRIRRTKVLIIDEISMLQAGTLSMVEMVCRTIKQTALLFGGIQVVLVGDFFQLPPIVSKKGESEDGDLFDHDLKSPFAYNAPVWERANFFVCYLTEQYRQDDSDFLAILSAIRANSFSEYHLEHLTKRVVLSHNHKKNITKLFSHNVDVDRVNNEALANLTSQEKTFKMNAHGGPEALVKALKKGCLSPEVLVLKKGATVMFTKNNQKEGFSNGTLGTVLDFDALNYAPIVLTKDGRKIIVEPMDWIVEENGKVKASISQLPLRLAWAITVHKSQGMSLDEAVMDLREVFEYGQGYVALSRVRRLSGLHLIGWNEQAFRVHPEILDKDEEFRLASAQFEESFTRLPAPELQTMHRNFIVACGGTVTAKEVPVSKSKSVLKSEKIDTYTETLHLWIEGQTLEQIAKTRGLTVGTILGHLEKLKAKEKITSQELTRLLSPQIKRALADIHKAFRELGIASLTPTFDKFNGHYGYDQLKIARLVFD